MDYFGESINLTLSETHIELAEVDGIVIGVHENLAAREHTAFSRIKEAIGSVLDFKGKENEITILYNQKGIT